MYNATENLIEKASVNISRNMILDVDIKLNKNIPFVDTERQNIPMALEKGGGFLVKGGKPVPTGNYLLRNKLGVRH